MNKFLILTVAILSFSLSACGSETCPDGRAWSILTEEQDEMLTLINEARDNAELSPLSRDVLLGLVAFEHSKDMACRNFLDHINPDGQDPGDRVQEAGEAYAPPWRWISENIGTYASAGEQFDSWMNSEGHRDNILDDRVDEIGVALIHISEGSDYRYYWTVVFLGRNH